MLYYEHVGVMIGKEALRAPKTELNMGSKVPPCQSLHG